MTKQKRWIKSWLSQVNQARKQREIARRRAKQEGYLVVLGIMKNEALILQEWIDHYLWQGADKIILIDNGSSDASMEIAKSNQRGGKVECISRPQRHNQANHYRHAIHTFRLREKYEWLLIADLDEFWFCRDGSLVGESLRKETYDWVDLIYVNWTVFGSSGFVHQPKSVRESFVMRKPELHHHGLTKWVCRLAKFRQVNKLGYHKLSGFKSAKVISDNNQFQINHYAIQSREFYENVKMTRGDVATSLKDCVRTWEIFDTYDMNCSIEDRALASQVKDMTKGTP